MTTAIQRHDGRRQAMVHLEATLRDLKALHGLPDPDLPLSHVFAPGAYARTIFIPKDTLFVGKIHKHAHLNMLMQGDVSVSTEEGPMRMQAPQVLCSKAGTKRVVYTHTDTIWTTVHLTDSTDLAEIEEQVIAKTYEEFDAFHDTDVLQLTEVLSIERDRDDYRCVLIEQGMTQDDVTGITENLDDQILSVDPQDQYVVKESPIHGFGVFVTGDIAQGGQVGLMRIGAKRTPAGRYANHAKDPNCEAVKLPNGDFALRARFGLVSGEEATVNYRQVMAAKEAL